MGAMEAIQVWLPGLLEASLRVSVVIGLVLLVRALWQRRGAATWVYWLWALVLVRILIPTLPSSPVSLFNVWKPASTETTRLADPVPQVPLAEVAAHEVPVVDDVTPATVEASTEPMSRPSHDWDRMDSLALAWLAGALGVMGLALVSDLRLWWRVRTLRPVTDGDILELFEDCKTEMDVHTIVGLVLTDRVSSPCIFGVVRPRVLLPLGALESLSEKQLRFVFLHELAHLKRWDNLLGWLMLLAQVLHWFNPLVWFAMLRMRTDRELACDHRVLSLLSEQEAHAYGATIMDLSTGWSRLGTLPSMAGIVESRSLLQRRIEMIAEFKPQTKSRPWLALALLLVIALVTLTEAQSVSVRPPTLVDQMPQAMFDHLLLYYSFDKDGGSKAVDISGMGFHGVIRDGVYLTDGYRNGALQLNGESTQIVLDDMKLKAYTFATWARTETQSMNNRVLFQLYQGEQSYSFQGAATCPVDVYVSYDQSMGTTEDAWGSDEALPVGQWVHWAVTYDGESVVIYRNGRPYPAGSAKVSSFRQGPVYIGGADVWDRDSGGYWLGAMDEVALFNQALSTQQVQQLYAMYEGQDEANIMMTNLVVQPYGEGWQAIATVYNDSDDPVGPFDMDFYINDPEHKSPKRYGGGPIEPHGEFHEATLPFSLKEGVNTIEVVIDPEQEILKIDEGENKKSIAVMARDGAVTVPVFSSEQWNDNIDFDTYRKEFQAGDSICIDRIEGTATSLIPGQTYRVCGHYQLSSRDQAFLSLYATNGETRCGQRAVVTKGKGVFTRTFQYLERGYLHLSYYPTEGGDNFGGVYFKNPGGAEVSGPVTSRIGASHEGKSMIWPSHVSTLDLEIKQDELESLQELAKVHETMKAKASYKWFAGLCQDTETVEGREKLATAIKILYLLDGGTRGKILDEMSMQQVDIAVMLKISLKKVTIEGDESTWFYELEPVVANLNDPGANRYIRLSLALEMDGLAPQEKLRASLDAKRGVIKDVIGRYLASQSLADLQGDRNLNRVPQEIKNLLNKALFPDQDAPIVNVLYKERAIQ